MQEGPCRKPRGAGRHSGWVVASLVQLGGGGRFSGPGIWHAAHLKENNCIEQK